MPALDPVTPRPQGPRALRWMGGQWIWRLAMYSSSLRIGLVARFSAASRRASVRPTAPTNKLSPDPSQAWLLLSPATDLEMSWSGLAGKTMAPSRPLPFVLRIRRRRGRDLRLCSWIREPPQELRRRRWFSVVGARERWCPGARLLVRVGESGLASTTWSIGALGSRPREHGFRPGRRATELVPCRSWWGSASTHKAIGDGATSVFREDGSSCPSPASRRRRLVRSMVSVAERLCRDLGVFLSFFRGLSAIVPGHWLFLEFFRDFCVCTSFVLELC